METNDQMVMAEWWRRFAALVIDSAVLWIPTMLLTRSMDRPFRLVWDQRRQALHDKLAGSAVVPAS